MFSWFKKNSEGNQMESNKSINFRDFVINKKFKRADKLLVKCVRCKNQFEPVKKLICAPCDKEK